MTFDIFEDNEHYTGPPLTEEMVRRAEADLGVRLPAAYIELLSHRNGGVPRHTCYPTKFANSWACDHIEIDGILGIGGEWGIDAVVGGSRYMISEWGYPDIGVVICITPSAGHDTVMLDYSESGPHGEPAVVHVDEDRIPRKIADTFDEFLNNLLPRSRFPSSGYIG